MSSPRCTVERYDSDGVHVYGCDDVEVPHIALANDNLYPRPMIDDGPDDIYDTLAAAVRLADVQRRGQHVHHRLRRGRKPLSSCGTLETGGGPSCFTAERTGTGIRVLSSPIS